MRLGAVLAYFCTTQNKKLEVEVTHGSATYYIGGRSSSVEKFKQYAMRRKRKTSPRSVYNAMTNCMHSYTQTSI